MKDYFYGITETLKPSPSILLDALLAALFGWAMFMCALVTMLRAWRKK